MLKIISSYLQKESQSFIDWDSDDFPQDTPSTNKAINDGNYEEYLTDNVDDFDDAIELDDIPQESGHTQFLDEMPTGNEMLGIPPDTKEIVYPNPLDLIYDGIENHELISFQYTNRHGAYAGLRTVEPHYTFMAMTTGNEILVTFDRDVNDIRAFIVGNIHPNGVLYRGVTFEPRPEIGV